MPPDPTEADRHAARVAALNLVLQGLLERLLLAGVIDPGDLEQIRKFATVIPAGLRTEVSAGFGMATAAEVDAFFRAMNIGPGAQAH